MQKFFLIIFTLFLFSCVSRKTSKKKFVEAYPSEGKIDSDIAFITASIPHHKKVQRIHYNIYIDSIVITDPNIKSFIPKGYSVMDTSSGDLNLDKLTDMILVLRKDNEEETSRYYNNKPTKRPMLLLLQQPNHTYKLVCRNDDAILCVDCGGLDGDPFIGVAVKNGYFSIETGVSGGVEHWQEVATFKYNISQNNWDLYKEHYIDYKFNDDQSDTAQALVKDIDSLETKKVFGLVPFSKFDCYNDRGY